MTFRIPLMTASAAMLALAACTDQYGNPQPMNRAQQGAAVGAAAGAIFGAQRDDDRTGKGRDALRGAVVGGALGGLVGSIMDTQAKALQQSITTPGVTVQNTGNQINVNLPEGVLFAFDSAAVSGPAQNDLYAIARNLQAYPNTRVEVIGHTDSVGADAYNMDLSQRRARAVGGILAAGGVSSSRIVTIGRGKTMPIASNATAQGRAQNRRVEIVIRPM